MQTCHSPQQQFVRLPKLSGVFAALQPCRASVFRLSPAASPVGRPGLHMRTGRLWRRRSSVMLCVSTAQTQSTAQLYIMSACAWLNITALHRNRKPMGRVDTALTATAEATATCGGAASCGSHSAAAGAAAVRAVRGPGDASAAHIPAHVAGVPGRRRIPCRAAGGQQIVAE